MAPWFRGLFIGRPDVDAIRNAPLIYQIHATAAWAIFVVWPFSRLAHAWSFPLIYLWRPFIVYRRRRATRPAEPGTTLRRWRRIGRAVLTPAHRGDPAEDACGGGWRSGDRLTGVMWASFRW